MEDIKFTWIPFYKELAKALLVNKDNRKPLVDWIYSELSQVSPNSLVNYLKQGDGSKIIDIDPFSVFAIFNRGLKLENKIDFLKKFKEKFSLTSEVPENFEGIPTVNSMRAFFFSWEDNNDQLIHDLWELFENVVLEKDISQIFDKVISDGVARNSLTMILYWISPYQFISLDDRNRSYINTLGFPDKYPNLDYNQYSKLIKEIKLKMNDIHCSTFPELSYKAWCVGNTGRLWMYNGDEQLFSASLLKMGVSAEGKIKFEQFKNKAKLIDTYREVAGNKDVSIPQMYWEFMHEVKIGDVVVVFKTRKDKGKQWHQLYGWGKFISDYKLDYSDENPIQRDVEWHLPIPKEPIDEKKTKNALYFHDVKGIEAANIIKLLGINNKQEEIMETISHNKYIQLLKSNKNLILTGAPGTGKTHLAKEIAKEMLGIKKDEDLITDKRYGFVQFHPSYDYTDFVEGLRPIKGLVSQVGFERKDGVFKEFCKQAILSETTDSDTFGEINNNPTVWKVSLEGTGDNPTRKDCMDNGYIRIGWNRYGDVDDFNDYNDFTDGGKNVLRAFQSGMQIGDIVVSCYSAKEIDAVGVITGDYEYRAEGGNYPRYRTVRWLVKDIRENIVELNNNKPFTLSTVYKASITAEDALKIVQKYTNNAEIVKQDTAVFVIDEINRGEISKIFGELFFSIDPGYRGKKGIVKTQYQNLIDEGDVFKDGFYVPENVYIIGTMNDIDRSVESMDFAMRRRFAWEEITAEESMKMLEGTAYETEAKNHMIRLNKAILKINGLNEAYQIGASYFMHIKDYNGNFEDLWNYHLKGLLFEYLRGNVNANKQLDELKKAYDNKLTADDDANPNQG